MGKVNKNPYPPTSVIIILLFFFASFLFTDFSGSKPVTLSHKTGDPAIHHHQISCSKCHPQNSGDRVETCSPCHDKDIPEKTRSCSSCHVDFTHHDLPAVAANVMRKSLVCSECHKQHHIPGHYGPHCGECHTLVSWIVKESTDTSCEDCHGRNRPYTHYLTASCFLCHSHSWKEPEFTHLGFTSCEKCHKRPKRHRPGKCEFCHDTEDWGHAS